MRRIVGLSAFFLVMTVLMFSPNQANALCCFPYNMNYYIDPITGNFVLNGELNNDSYQQKPFGNTSYRFVFSDKDNNIILERNILLTDILPIRGGVTIPLAATFPFQIVMSDIDPKVVQQISNFRIDGTNSIDYFGWKPADLVISSSQMTNVGIVHGKNGDVFAKWKISGNITNTNSEKTENAYVVASLRDKNDNILGVAGYSDDSVQPVTLNGFETKNFELFALIPASETPSSANLYAESDDSSMVFPYYKPIIIRDTMNYDERNVMDPKKPVIISANITNISRDDLDYNLIIQIKKSPKSISEGDISEYPESKIAFVKSVPGHIGAQKSAELEYSWTPQSNGIYFYEMYVWDSSNAKALSYPVMQSFLTDNWLVVKSNLNSVKNQIKSGIPLDKIQCVKGLEPAHKASNGNLVCVKPETKEKLIKRGWIDLPPDHGTGVMRFDELTMPDDFGLVYSFGVGGKNTLDTKKKLYKADMICEPQIEINLELSHDDLYQIWDISHKNDFFALDDFMDNCDSFGNCKQVTPEQITAVTITEEGKTHSVMHRDSYISKPNDGYSKFQKITNTIQGILDKKPEIQSLPQLKCGYE